MWFIVAKQAEVFSSFYLVTEMLCLQYVVEGLPFGGVGQSGSGQYHGKYSFELFSNKKAVFKRSFLIEFMFRYPPWDNGKIGMLRHVFNTNYVLLLLGLIGLRR
jgi:aldehyde dehydrogenase (NAD+)